VTVKWSSGPRLRREELPLEELGFALCAGALGNYTSGLVSHVVGGKMPGGFNITSIKGHLLKAWGLSPSWSDGVLLLGTTMEPNKRLASEAEVNGWLDTIVTSYTQHSGISLLVGGAGLKSIGIPQVPS
jgi:fatty acid synthase subunit alpha, fungi type